MKNGQLPVLEEKLKNQEVSTIRMERYLIEKIDNVDSKIQRHLEEHQKMWWLLVGSLFTGMITLLVTILKGALK